MKQTEKKAAIFILLGQSNAVGHGVPMEEKDIISVPLKNVYGLSRKKNQSFDNDSLYWDNYVSAGMNLAEEQDDTYSVANLLASKWQEHIDSGNAEHLPDLYIVHIAIGAQGVTDGYMWNPGYPHRLVPGKLGTVDISLFEFSSHVFSLLDKSFAQMGKEYEIKGVHWRGGENDTSGETDVLFGALEKIYCEIFGEFCRILGEVPIYLHRLIMKERTFNLDPSGEKYLRMGLVNAAFEKLCEIFPKASIFDIRRSPLYLPDTSGNGVFIKDKVHYTPEANAYVADAILGSYIKQQKKI